MDAPLNLLHYSIIFSEFLQFRTRGDVLNFIPSYELYGELLSNSVSEAVHHEAIKERSIQHDWTIRLHRHRRLAQIFLFRSPGVSCRLGDVEFTSNQPMILIAPPGVPHAFRFSDTVNGDVLSIRLDEMHSAMQQRIKQCGAQTKCFFLKEHTHEFQHIADLFEQLGDVYRRPSNNRAAIVTNIVDLITLYLAANIDKRDIIGPPNNSPNRDRRDMKAEAFCALLEANFQNAWSVADYAKEVGISAPHLTRICRIVLGSSPNSLVRQRRILEAKRLLEYTALSISEIAHSCGFNDAAFFSRTFKTAVGESPNVYRRGVG